MHDGRSVFSAPDLRNVVTEVFREGCIVASLARPARISGPYPGNGRLRDSLD